MDPLLWQLVADLDFASHLKAKIIRRGSANNRILGGSGEVQI